MEGCTRPSKDGIDWGSSALGHSSTPASFYATFQCAGLTSIARRVVQDFHTARNRVLKLHKRWHELIELKLNQTKAKQKYCGSNWVCWEHYLSICVTYIFFTFMIFFFMRFAFSSLKTHMAFTSSKNDTFCHAVDISAGGLWLLAWLLLQWWRWGFPLGAGGVTSVCMRLTPLAPSNFPAFSNTFPFQFAPVDGDRIKRAGWYFCLDIFLLPPPFTYLSLIWNFMGWKGTKSDVLGSDLLLSRLGVAGHTTGAACQCFGSSSSLQLPRAWLHMKN